MPTPKDLLNLAPHYHRWVDALLAEHAGSARGLGGGQFASVGQCFNSITLDDARYVVVERLPVLPFAQLGFALPRGMDSGLTGVAYRNVYFLLPSVAESEAAHFHELIHVVQWKILGPTVYPLVYFHEAFSKGYRGNFLEAGAYDLQGQFEKGGIGGPVETVVAAKIGFHLPQLLDQLLKTI